MTHDDLLRDRVRALVRARVPRRKLPVLRDVADAVLAQRRPTVSSVLRRLFGSVGGSPQAVAYRRRALTGSMRRLRELLGEAAPDLDCFVIDEPKVRTRVDHEIIVARERAS